MCVCMYRFDPEKPNHFLIEPKQTSVRKETKRVVVMDLFNDRHLLMHLCSFHLLNDSWFGCTKMSGGGDTYTVFAIALVLSSLPNVVSRGQIATNKVSLLNCSSKMTSGGIISFSQQMANAAMTKICYGNWTEAHQQAIKVFTIWSLLRMRSFDAESSHLTRAKLVERTQQNRPYLQHDFHVALALASNQLTEVGKHAVTQLWYLAAKFSVSELYPLRHQLEQKICQQCVRCKRNPLDGEVFICQDEHCQTGDQDNPYVLCQGCWSFHAIDHKLLLVGTAWDWGRRPHMGGGGPGHVLPQYAEGMNDQDETDLVEVVHYCSCAVCGTYPIYRRVFKCLSEDGCLHVTLCPHCYHLHDSRHQMEVVGLQDPPAFPAPENVDELYVAVPNAIQPEAKNNRSSSHRGRQRSNRRSSSIRSGAASASSSAPVNVPEVKAPDEAAPAVVSDKVWKINGISKGRTYFKQQQYWVEWTDQKSDWHTRDQLLLGGGQWLLAPPYDDVVFLTAAVDAITEFPNYQRPSTKKKKKRKVSTNKDAVQPMPLPSSNSPPPPPPPLPPRGG